MWLERGSLEAGDLVAGPLGEEGEGGGRGEMSRALCSGNSAALLRGLGLSGEQGTQRRLPLGWELPAFGSRARSSEEGRRPLGVDEAAGRTGGRGDLDAGHPHPGDAGHPHPGEGGCERLKIQSWLHGIYGLEIVG